jgi:hypothetical protein
MSTGTTTKGQENNLAILNRLNCAHGLASLATRKYKCAAKHFLAANLDHCDIPDLMSTQNVATYGGLCALATFDREELQKQVISSTSFKLFLELDPQLREVRSFALLQFAHILLFKPFIHSGDLQLPREQVRQVPQATRGDSRQSYARHVSRRARQQPILHDQEQGAYSVL